MLTLLSISTLALTSVASLDDEMVVNAALTKFFKKEAWNSPNWCKGDFIVLGSEYSTSKRPDFQANLKQDVQTHQSKYGIRATLDGLRRISRLSVQGTKSFSPGKPLPLSQMVLDSRITIQSDPYRSNREGYGWSPGVNKVKGRSGTVGTARAVGMISPPGYSRNGRFAVVTYLTVWSIHRADIRFYLEKINGQWTVVLIEPKFYV